MNQNNNPFSNINDIFGKELGEMFGEKAILDVMNSLDKQKLETDFMESIKNIDTKGWTDEQRENLINAINPDFLKNLLSEDSKKDISKQWGEFISQIGDMKIDDETLKAFSEVDPSTLSKDELNKLISGMENIDIDPSNPFASINSIFDNFTQELKEISKEQSTKQSVQQENQEEEYIQPEYSPNN